MNARTWISAMSQELISNILSTSKNVYFCRRMSQYHQLMCREGEKKGKKEEEAQMAEWIMDFLPE